MKKIICRREDMTETVSASEWHSLRTKSGLKYSSLTQREWLQLQQDNREQYQTRDEVVDSLSLDLSPMSYAVRSEQFRL